jgi:hypothetical protein
MSYFVFDNVAIAFRAATAGRIYRIYDATALAISIQLTGDGDGDEDEDEVSVQVLSITRRDRESSRVVVICHWIVLQANAGDFWTYDQVVVDEATEETAETADHRLVRRSVGRPADG